MVHVVRFVDRKHRVILELYISSMTTGKDLVKWLVSHCGSIHHMSTIYRLYARNKYYNCTFHKSDSKLQLAFNVIDHNGRILLQITDEHGLVAEALPHCFLEI